MLIDSMKVFDDVVTGASSTWYTSATFNDRLGRADELVVQAVTSGVSGGMPTLTVALEHSGDNEHWIAVDATPFMNNLSIDDDGVQQGFDSTMSTSRFVRMKITLGGTSPQCRLEVYAAVRAYGVAANGQPTT